MKRFKIVMYTCVLVTALSTLSLGQAVYGNIIGTVTDASGAAVPNAAVTITDLDRGQSHKITANASGNYEQTHFARWTLQNKCHGRRI